MAEEDRYIKKKKKERKVTVAKCEATERVKTCFRKVRK